jgi:SAM-dependent methyltransferase
VCLVVVLGFIGVGGASGQTSDPAASPLAKHLVDKAGMTHGVCSLLSPFDERLALDVVRSSQFLVHVVDTRESAVAALRAAADRTGLYGTRLVAETAPLDRLPYAANIVDVIMAVNIGDAQLDELRAEELMRALRPLGKAILGVTGKSAGAMTPAHLKAWLKRSGFAPSLVKKDRFGVWVELVKPRQKGIDAWSHWEHGPDNNPVSTDTAIRAPYMTQWMAEPYYISMPAITTAAGGRTFLAIGHIAHHEREEPWLNSLLARNGYNGAELWRRRLPDGYLVHRSAFIATDDTFYMIDPGGQGCLMLDPETGNEKNRDGQPVAPDP